MRVNQERGVRNTQSAAYWAAKPEARESRKKQRGGEVK